MWAEKKKISDFNKKYVEKSCLKTCELKVVNKLLKCISLDLRIETKSIKNTVQPSNLCKKSWKQKQTKKSISRVHWTHKFVKGN